MGKVRIASSDRVGQKGPSVSFDLEPTTHPKGGEAWTVSRAGTALGILRRWEREVIKAVISPRSATFRKTHEPRWTAYSLTGERLAVHGTRTEALRSLLGVTRG